ncbi:fasciclin domain-containing protein, partial [Klebsiella pneumoniae]|nr:fasciclin domain-containing protein [Klebsiella pneumoniae]
TFARLLDATRLGGLLHGDDAYTIFAPTDAAFEKFPATSIGALMENADLMRAVTAHHLALGKVRSKRFAGVRIRANT